MTWKTTNSPQHFPGLPWKHKRNTHSSKDVPQVFWVLSPGDWCQPSVRSTLAPCRWSPYLRQCAAPCTASCSGGSRWHLCSTTTVRSRPDYCSDRHKQDKNNFKKNIPPSKTHMLIVKTARTLSNTNILFGTFYFGWMEEGCCRPTVEVIFQSEQISVKILSNADFQNTC